MILPEGFMKLSLDKKSDFFSKVVSAINATDEFRYPMIHAQLQDDVSKVKLINDIVSQVYSFNGELDVNKILESYNIAMDNDSE